MSATANPVIPAEANPVSNPPKKRKRRERWKLIPYRDPGVNQRPPIFRHLLRALLELPKDKFQELTQENLPMSHIVACRLIAGAASGDEFCVRELLDRTDGRPPLELPAQANGDVPKSASIHVIYDDPSPQMRARNKVDMCDPQALLPGEVK